MYQIKNILAYEIIDSRGNPTVACEIILASDARGWAAVPSGASTGSREALELRDGDAKRFGGKGVQKAIAAILGPVREAIWQQSFNSQQTFDAALLQLDQSANKKNLGANAILAVSLAMAKAMAAQNHQDLYQFLHTGNEYILPVPMMNIINGGAHADNNVDIQEFMIMPVGVKTFADAVRCGAEIFQTLKKLLQKQNLSVAVGDEGGFAPNLPSNEAALKIILEAIEKAGYQPGRDVYLGLDVASSEFFQEGDYYLAAENKKLSSAQFADMLAQWVQQYPILSIEDGMAENDWPGWELLTQKLGNKVQLVGDDVFVTNPQILRQGIDQHIGNAILIKPNQIGSLWETLEAIGIAKQAGYGTVISHRSGETEDTTIADLAVATNAGQIKTGSLCRTDRVAKYNRLLRIEVDLGNKARYAGRDVFKRWLT